MDLTHLEQGPLWNEEGAVAFLSYDLNPSEHPRFQFFAGIRDLNLDVCSSGVRIKHGRDPGNLSGKCPARVCIDSYCSDKTGLHLAVVFFDYRNKRYDWIDFDQQNDGICRYIGLGDGAPVHGLFPHVSGDGGANLGIA